MKDIFLVTYEKLLRWYPEEVREQYAEQMIITATDMLRDRKEKPRLMIMLRLGIDLQKHLVAENSKYIGEKIMHKNTQIIHFAIWLAVSVAAALSFGVAQGVGTTWKNNAGFLRLLGLLVYIALLIITPAVMALLALFGRTLGARDGLARR